MTDEQKERRRVADEKANIVLGWDTLEQAVVYRTLYNAGMRLNDVERIIERETRK